MRAGLITPARGGGRQSGDQFTRDTTHGLRNRAVSRYPSQKERTQYDQHNRPGLRGWRVSEQQPCGQCPMLHAEIVRQRALIDQLQQMCTWLSNRLAELRGAVAAAEALMRSEAERPTMPRGRLLTQLHERLITALFDADRR
ncbi:hypothetical protein [Catellatospora sp. NPDC049133]|uniref:hypothetical protein n=1 Tax=Catellatospora sp. NPDC049133 TaxID=3155499 RepID=UPI0033EB6023